MRGLHHASWFMFDTCTLPFWCVRLTTLPPSCAVVMKSGNLNFLEPSGPVQGCNGTALPLPFTLPFTVISLCPDTMRLFNLNAQYTVKFSALHLAVSWLTWLVTASHFKRPGVSPSMPIFLSLLFCQCLYLHVPFTVCNRSNWQNC